MSVTIRDGVVERREPRANRAARVAYALERARQVASVGYQGYKAYQELKKMRGDSEVKQPAVKRKGVKLQNAQGGNTKVVSKRQKRRPKRKMSIKKRVASLEDKISDTVAIKHVRSRTYSQINSGKNGCAYNTLNVCNWATLEAYSDNLKYLSLTGTPGENEVNLTNAAANATWQVLSYRNFYFQVVGRNNNTIPTNVRLYWLKVSEPTSSTPVAIMNVDDQYVNVSSADTSIMNYFTDFPTASKKFKLLKTDKFLVNPGDQFVKSIPLPDRKWSPTLKSVANNTYQKGDYLLVMRVEGVIAHDAVSTSAIGIAESSIDYYIQLNFDIRYPSSVNYRYFETAENGNAMAGGAEATTADVEENKDTT